MSSNLIDIIETVKDGGQPEYEDLLYAVIALEALRHFDSSALRRLGFAKPSAKNNAEYQAEESFQRAKRAMQKPPKEYVGWNNDPKNPDYQKTGQISKKIFGKVMDLVIAEDEGE